MDNSNFFHNMFQSNNIKTIEFTKLFFKPGNKRQTLLLYSLRKEEIDVDSVRTT